jgi:DNA-binding protein YbaB
MSDLDRSIAQAYERSEVAAEAGRRLLNVRGVGSSEDGLVTAVVSGAGELLDLRIAPAAMRLGPGRLGEAIVAAARHASDDARQRGYTLLALAVGDEATAEVERFDGPVPARAMGWDTVSAAGTRPRTSPRTSSHTPSHTGAIGSDDDIFSFDASIFRSDR